MEAESPLLASRRRMARRLVVAGALIGAVASATFAARSDALAEERNLVKERVGLVLNVFACRAGDGGGCNYVGRASDEGWGGLAKDAGRAARYYELACEAGHALGCSNLGVSHQAGDGVPVDLRRAVDLYAQACAAGAKPGCTNLGTLFDAGVGVPRNPDRARALFLMACAGGHAHACTRLSL
jgi:TPR repeat protein